MDLRQLEMFIAVADNASFRRAALQLHVAQSAISRKVRLLEEELAEPLFSRANKKVSLLAPGQILLRHARRVFQELRNASLEISEMSHLEYGKLRIGAGIMACAYILPPVLEKFRTLHPRIELDVVDGRTDVLLGMLRDNSIDMAVLTLPVQQADVEVIPLCTEEMVVVTSAKHPSLSRSSWIKPQVIQQHPLITFPRDAHTRRVQEDFFRRAGISPRIAMEAENIATIKPLVAMNLGISILPLRAVAQEMKRKELHCLRIRNYKVARQLGLVYNKSNDLPKILAELIRLFKETQNPPA